MLIDDSCVCETGYALEGNACEMQPRAGVGNDAGTGGDDIASRYTGQKEPCAADADCADFDATFCDTRNNYCVVPDCMDGSCDQGWTCTDLSEFMPGLPKVCTFDADRPS
ncbi:MAG: hypothetical protein QM778_17995 [Myxococcales bacterium]